LVHQDKRCVIISLELVEQPECYVAIESWSGDAPGRTFVVPKGVSIGWGLRIVGVASGMASRFMAAGSNGELFDMEA